MPERRSPAYRRTFGAIAVGSVAFAALGAGLGRGIAAVGDPTAAVAVPVVVCAAFGYAIGGAFGANVTLQGRGFPRAGLTSTVVLVVLLVTLAAAGALSSASGVPFYVLLPAGPLLAAAVAVVLSAHPT